MAWNDAYTTVFPAFVVYRQTHLLACMGLNTHAHSLTHNVWPRREQVMSRWSVRLLLWLFNDDIAQTTQNSYSLDSLIALQNAVFTTFYPFIFVGVYLSISQRTRVVWEKAQRRGIKGVYDGRALGGNRVTDSSDLPAHSIHNTWHPCTPHAHTAFSVLFRVINIYQRSAVTRPLEQACVLSQAVQTCAFEGLSQCFLAFAWYLASFKINALTTDVYFREAESEWEEQCLSVILLCSVCSRRLGTAMFQRRISFFAN